MGTWAQVRRGLVLHLETAKLFSSPSTPPFPYLQEKNPPLPTSQSWISVHTADLTNPPPPRVNHAECHGALGREGSEWTDGEGDSFGR